jgi:hypothetical protein
VRERVVPRYAGAPERPAGGGALGRAQVRAVAVTKLHETTLDGSTRVDSGIRAGRHCVFALRAHLVFVTKYRHAVFAGRHLERLEEITRDVCADFEVQLEEFNGEPDHVRLLVNFPPKVALSELIN